MNTFNVIYPSRGYFYTTSQPMFKQTGISLFLILFGFLAHATAPKLEFIKKINREFGTNATGMTALYNKYGQVNVKTWGNNSVKIDITVTVNTNNQKEADAMFDKIQVNFTNTTGYIKAETMIAQSNWWGPKCDNFKIDYEVYMPVGNQLDLKNKYGNAFVADLNGKLMAEIKYGDLRAENLRADADLYLGYGKVFISKVQNLYGQISYGELKVNEAKDLQLDTRYSDMDIVRANAVRITSKYDDFDLGTVDDLRLQTKYADIKTQNVRVAYITAQYSDVKIGNLSEVLDAEQSYGSLRLDMLGRNAQSVNLNGKYTDFKVNLEKGTSCRFEIDCEHADTKVPSGANLKTDREDGSRKYLKGSIGDSNAKCQLQAKLQYGGFLLTNK
jgi:hypothetical protein